MAEARQGHAGGAALVDHRGDAGMHAHHVGIQAEAAGDVMIDVGVRVDHAGKHQPPTNVDGLLGGGRQDVFLHGGDLAVADGDVHHAVDAGRGTNDVSAAKQQIIGFVVGHGWSPSSAVAEMISPSILEGMVPFPAHAICHGCRFLGIRRKASGIPSGLIFG